MHPFDVLADALAGAIEFIIQGLWASYSALYFAVTNAIRGVIG